MPNRKETVQKTFVTCRNHVLEEIKKGAHPDDIMDVITLMAHYMLTQGGELSLERSNQNLERFHFLLKNSIAKTQAKVHKPASRLM